MQSTRKKVLKEVKWSVDLVKTNGFLKDFNELSSRLCWLLRDTEAVEMPFSDICSTEDIPSYISWCTVVISICFCIMTVPGNFLTCVAIIKDPFRELRTPFNYFIINLAVSDLIVGCVTEPGFIIYHVKEAMKGQKLHELWIFHVAYFVSLSASLLSLSALTIDRCLTITSPLRRKLKPKHGHLTSIAIWCVSLIIPLLYFLVKFYVFLFIFANTAALVVLIILLTSHKRIAKTLKNHVRRWDLIENNALKRKAVLRERQVTRFLKAMLTLFCFAVFPSCIIAYVIAFCSTCSCDLINILRDVFFLLPMAISASNQLLYAMRMQNFRRAFAFLFRCASCGKLRTTLHFLSNKVADRNKETITRSKRLSLKPNQGIECLAFKEI